MGTVGGEEVAAGKESELWAKEVVDIAADAKGRAQMGFQHVGRRQSWRTLVSPKEVDRLPSERGRQ